MVGRDFEMYAHHLEAEPERHEFTAPVAVLAAHPSEPGKFGLQNRSTDTWTVNRPDGPVRDVGPGGTVNFRTGIRIDMRGVSVEVRGRESAS